MSLRDLMRAALVLIALIAARPSVARAQSEEERRRQLQERLGVKRPPGGPKTSTPDAGVAGPLEPLEEQTPPTVDPAAPSASGKVTTGAAPTRSRVPTFTADALPILEKACASCHAPGGKAAKSRWVLQSDDDYAATLRYVNTADPAQSPLLRKGIGATAHGGKKSMAADSPEYATLLRWIEAGAPQGRAPAATTATPPTNASPTGAAAGSTPGGATREAGRTQTGAGSPTTAAGPTEAPGATPASTPQGSDESPRAPATGEPAGTSRFAPGLHAQLLTDCASCHAADEMAGASRYVTHADVAQHFASARALVTPNTARGSVLYERARGEDHGGGAIWETGSAELARLAQWIEAGALGADDGPAVATAGETKVAPPAGSSQTTGASAGATSSPPAAHPHAGGGPNLSNLLSSFRLGGRFDLNYERLGYHDHPFQTTGVDALRSYHQFLFLTRQSAEDPVTLSLELLSLQFWEVGYRLSGKAWPVKVHAKLGRLLVPLGSDPLYHHSYGGHAGFDQRVLPVVFAREGVSVNVQRRLGAFALSADAYVIAGYRLRRADAVLNLQSDFAPLEETKLGLGARLGASWGPINVWYSPYYNTLGFGRRLFLQALDLTVWRPRGLPVLEHFSLGAGLLRGDVSGGAEEGFGGRGADYYHFASYLQLRYYPTDWLYLQYRQGLRTIGNQRGLILDESRLTAEDGSTHNAGVVARLGGLTCGLYHYWNLEKANEIPDDFTRLVVAYEF